MSLSLVRTAVEQHIELERVRSETAWRERHSDTVPHLFVSDVGSCPRKAVWSAVNSYHKHPLRVEATHPFSPYVQAIMRAGIVWEKETEAALRAIYGDDLQTQVPARNTHWSGRPDFILPNNIIVEHKATNPYNFKAKGRLPYRHHCLQVLAYQRILRLPVSTAQLYYRGWADWAEFAVWDTGDTIGWEGLVNGYYKEGSIKANLIELMDNLETFWALKVLPPKYISPTSENFACTRKTRKGRYPNCQFFGRCWPDLPQEGPWKD